MFAYISDISKWISWCFEASSSKQQKINLNLEKTPFGQWWFNVKLKLQSSDLQTDVATFDPLTVQEPQNERRIMSVCDRGEQGRRQGL